MRRVYLERAEVLPRRGLVQRQKSSEIMGCILFWQFLTASHQSEFIPTPGDSPAAPQRSERCECKTRVVCLLFRPLSVRDRARPSHNVAGSQWRIEEQRVEIGRKERNDQRISVAQNQGGNLKGGALLRLGKLAVVRTGHLPAMSCQSASATTRGARVVPSQLDENRFDRKVVLPVG